MAQVPGGHAFQQQLSTREKGGGWRRHLPWDKDRGDIPPMGTATRKYSKAIPPALLFQRAVVLD